jgi:hypothetical protein
LESVEKNAKKFANKKVTGKRSVQNWGLYKRHEYNVKQHDCYVKRHDYTVKRHDYTVKRHNFNVKRHEYIVKHHVSWYPFSQIDKKNLFTVLQMV